MFTVVLAKSMLNILRLLNGFLCVNLALACFISPSQVLSVHFWMKSCYDFARVLWLDQVLSMWCPCVVVSSCHLHFVYLYYFFQFRIVIVYYAKGFRGLFLPLYFLIWEFLILPVTVMLTDFLYIAVCTVIRFSSRCLVVSMFYWFCNCSNFSFIYNYNLNFKVCTP